MFLYEQVPLPDHINIHVYVWIFWLWTSKWLNIHVNNPHYIKLPFVQSNLPYEMSNFYDELLSWIETSLVEFWAILLWHLGVKLIEPHQIHNHHKDTPHFASLVKAYKNQYWLWEHMSSSLNSSQITWRGHLHCHLRLRKASMSNPIILPQRTPIIEWTNGVDLRHTRAEFCDI